MSKLFSNQKCKIFIYFVLSLTFCFFLLLFKLYDMKIGLKGSTQGIILFFSLMGFMVFLVYCTVAIEDKVALEDKKEKSVFFIERSEKVVKKEKRKRDYSSLSKALQKFAKSNDSIESDFHGYRLSIRKEGGQLPCTFFKIRRNQGITHFQKNRPIKILCAVFGLFTIELNRDII